MAFAVADVTDRLGQHALHRGDLHLYRLLAVGTPAAGSHRGQVVPFALLVPFVGAAASSVVFGETFGPLRLAGMITVVGGIAVMLLSKRPQAMPKIA